MFCARSSNHAHPPAAASVRFGFTRPTASLGHLTRNGRNRITPPTWAAGAAYPETPCDGGCPSLLLRREVGRTRPVFGGWLHCRAPQPITGASPRARQRGTLRSAGLRPAFGPRLRTWGYTALGWPQDAPRLRRHRAVDRERDHGRLSPPPRRIIEPGPCRHRARGRQAAPDLTAGSKRSERGLWPAPLPRGRPGRGAKPPSGGYRVMISYSSLCRAWTAWTVTFRWIRRWSTSSPSASSSWKWAAISGFTRMRTSCPPTSAAAAWIFR